MMLHLSSTIQVCIGFPAGTAAGWIHFNTLYWNVRLLTGRTPGRAIAIQLLRLGVLAAIFFVLAKIGAWALLSGAAGLLIARFTVLRRVRAQL